MRLALKKSSSIPLFAECISPDIFSGKGITEIRELECLWGNKTIRIEDFFDVEEEGEEIEIFGDASSVRHIGANMTSGRIAIHGNAGNHLGAQMNGGEIIVEGNASDWCGAEMGGGRIEIKGNAGNFLGGAYRGSESGMKGGTIVVHGNGGHECGVRMRRGLIAVWGSLKDFTGLHMRGGTIVCFGNLGERTGALMDRGTIVCYKKPILLQTFFRNAAYNPLWLRFLLKTYADILPVKEEYLSCLYERYTGDVTELGKGEIFVAVEKGIAW